MNYTELKMTAQLDRPVTLPPEWDIFAHHFDGVPLFPGALSAFLLAEACGGEPWSLKKVKGLRFRKPLLPNLPILISCTLVQESENEKVCLGKIQSGTDTIADGEFVFAKMDFSPVLESRPEVEKCVWTNAQIREYLPHGEPIVLIDELVEAQYPAEVQEFMAGTTASDVDQTKLVGTRIHTRSKLNSGNFWLDQDVLPSTVLSELVAQAGALTLAPFFTGEKPQVSLLGCDTEYFARAVKGATIDTFVELTRAKRLGQSANMILFKCECFVGDVKIAQVNLNAMASFDN